MKNYKLFLLVIFLALFCTQRKINAQELWGMTSAGGSSNLGVLFKYDLVSNSYIKVLDFDGTGKGSNPYGSLIKASNGKLYGMTYGGGTFGLGVLFEFDPISNSYNKKIDFNGMEKGSNPLGSLMQASNGKIYGMTYRGGTSNFGVLFEFDPINNSFVKKLDFNGYTNGNNPTGSLMQATNGKLYGYTYRGGNSDLGILFEFDPVNNAFVKKLDLNGFVNGSSPFESLMQASNGKTYGMTENGGAYNYGVLFEFDLVYNFYLKKLDFNGPENGRYPRGNMMQATNGKLYGMTNNGGVGGATNNGVLFEFDPISNSFIKKLDFNGSINGSFPAGSLMQASNGKLYGMTMRGGTFDSGVLFEFDPGTDIYTKKLDLNSNDGAFPLYITLLEVENIAAPVAACQNTTLQLDVNGQANLQVSAIDGGSTGNGIALSASKTDFTCADVGENTVVLTVTDNNGKTSTCNAIVTVEMNNQLNASVSVTASDNPVCDGTTVTFTAHPTNGGTSPTYQWKLGGTNIPDATGETYSYTPSDGDAISVEMTSNSECTPGIAVTSDEVIMSVTPIPVAPAVGSITQPNCANQTGSVVLSNLPSGSWTINPGAITGSTASTTIYGLNPGTYNFTVFNSEGCPSPASVSVVINAPLGVPTTPIVTVSQPTCSVPSGSISVIAPIESKMTYSIGGNYQSGKTFNGLSAGNYNVTAKNSSGCISSITSVTILSNPAPAQPGSFTASTSQVTQGQQGVTYTVPFVDGVTYNWYYSGSGADITGTSNSVTVNFSTSATSGTLSVTASNSCGTSKPRSLYIKVNKLKSGMLTEAMKPLTDASIPVYDLKVYPNPFTEKLTLEFSNETDTHAKLDIYSITGAKITTLYDGNIRGGEIQTVEYLPKLVNSQMILYHLTLDGKTYIGKATFNNGR